MCDLFYSLGNFFVRVICSFCGSRVFSICALFLCFLAIGGLFLGIQLLIVFGFVSLFLGAPVAVAEAGSVGCDAVERVD